jgi:hypothetical protein
MSSLDLRQIQPISVTTASLVVAAFDWNHFSDP